jgi:hypothetical protein
LKIDTPHIHYQPLMRNTTSSGSNVHATKTASNIHTRHMLFNENETRPSCDEDIQSLNKKHRLTYQKLKKVIRERKKYIGSIRNTTSSGSSVNATQTTSNLHKRHMLFNQNETHPSCHEVIQNLKKKRRLTYHNLKKVIRERKNYIGTLPSRQKLTYHNLKKIVRAQKNRIFVFSTKQKHHMSN